MKPYETAANIAVGVSGGADSMALAFLLKDWAASNNIRLHALTVDHGLRAEAAEEAKTVKNIMIEHDFTHETLKFDDAIGDTRIQETAREKRYDAFSAYCKAHHIRHLFLAHHLDDQFETLLMRLAHGSGLKGLCGMTQERIADGIILVRPLLNISKNELINFCRDNQIEWIEDPSNNDTNYDRVLIRQNAEALEALGLTADMIEKSRMKLAEAQDFIKITVDQTRAHIVQTTDDGFVLNHRQFCDLHSYIRRQLLLELLGEFSDKPYPPKTDALDRLLENIQGHAFKGATLHNCKINLVQGDLIICPEK